MGSGASRVAAEPARATYLIFLFCRALVSLVRVPAETEWVAGWVQENPDVLLCLGRRHRGSQRDGLSNRGIEVPDLEVEVHHRALFPVHGRPDGGLVSVRLLEHDVNGSLGSGEYDRSRLLVSDRPAEQFGVELRQGARVRRFDSGSPPHAVRSRSHAGRLSQLLVRV